MQCLNTEAGTSIHRIAVALIFYAYKYCDVNRPFTRGLHQVQLTISTGSCHHPTFCPNQIFNHPIFQTLVCSTFLSLRLIMNASHLEMASQREPLSVKDLKDIQAGPVYVLSLTRILIFTHPAYIIIFSESLFLQRASASSFSVSGIPSNSATSSEVTSFPVSLPLTTQGK